MLSRKKWVVVHTPGAEFGATLGAVTDCELYVEASWHEEDGRLIKRFERERRPVGHQQRHAIAAADAKLRQVKLLLNELAEPRVGERHHLPAAQHEDARTCPMRAAACALRVVVHRLHLPGRSEEPQLWTARDERLWRPRCAFA